LPYKTYGVRKRNLGIPKSKRMWQIHNKDGPKTKVKNEDISHSTFFSTLLYGLFSTICFVWHTSVPGKSATVPGDFSVEGVCKKKDVLRKKKKKEKFKA